METIIDLGQKVKAKYPGVYDNLSDQEVGQKVKAKYPQYSQFTDIPTQKPPGFFQSLMQGMASPFLRAGVTAGKAITGLTGLGESALGKITGNKSIQSDAQKNLQFSQDMTPQNEGYFGKVSPLGYDASGKKLPFVKGVEDIAGAGVEAASYGIGGGETKTGLSALKEGGMQALKTAAKTGAEVGGTGAFGSTLQSEAQQNNSLGTQALHVGLNTVLGTLGGAIVGAGIHTGIEGVRLASNLYSPTEKYAQRLEDNLSSEYKTALKLKPTQIKQEEMWARDTPGFIARESIYNPKVRLETGPGNTLDTTSAVAQFENMANTENEAFTQILKSENKYVSIEDFRKKALSDIDTPQNRAKGSEYEKMVSQINSEVDALKRTFSKRQGVIAQTTPNGTDLRMPLDIFNEIKQGRWATAKGFLTASDKIYGDTNFQMGQTAKKIIEDNLTSEDAKAINKRLGNISSSIKLLNDRNGVKLSGGKLGRYFLGTVGTIVGSHLGAVDAILGGITGDKLAEVLQNPELDTGVKRWIITRVRNLPNYETVAQKAEKIMGKKLDEAANMKLLPGAGGTSSGPLVTPFTPPTQFDPSVPQTTKPQGPALLGPGSGTQQVSPFPIRLPETMNNQKDYFGPMR